MLANSSHGQAISTAPLPRGPHKLPPEVVVSRATFYAYFDNKRDCVIAAHETAFERLTARIFRACGSQREWPLKVKAAIADSLAFVTIAPATPSSATF